MKIQNNDTGGVLVPNSFGSVKVGDTLVLNGRSMKVSAVCPAPRRGGFTCHFRGEGAVPVGEVEVRRLGETVGSPNSPLEKLRQLKAELEAKAAKAKAAEEAKAQAERDAQEEVALREELLARGIDLSVLG